MFEAIIFPIMIVYGACLWLAVMMYKDYVKRVKDKRALLALEQAKIANDNLAMANAKSELKFKDADDFIKYHILNQFNSRPKITVMGHFYTAVNFEYLKEWLSEHLIKYPDAIIPKLSGTIIYTSDTAKYTMNFENATEPKIEKYIKTCMKLLKEKKTRKVNVLAEAEKVVKSKQRKVKILEPVLS